MGARGIDMTERIVVSSFEDVKESFRQRALKQALYDDGADLMRDVIVALHGDEHRTRRRVENRLFRRETFSHYEHSLVPAAVNDLLEPHLRDGWVDVLVLARRTMQNVSLLVSGIDRIDDSEQEAERIAGVLQRLARASTVAQSTLPKHEIVADGQDALREFETRYLAPSVARRREILARLDAGLIGEDDLPKDVLTTLLRYQQELSLTWEQVVKEVAYFPWVASHSTANAVAHTLEEVFSWLAAHPEDRIRAAEDPAFLQRCAHETLRLHPASPEAWRHALEEVRLRSGTVLPQGSFVVLDLTAANRDRSVFGDDADVFNPHRSTPAGAAPWGHSFGGGIHACIGQELAGGLAGVPSDSEHLFGTIVVMIQTLLRHGAEPDPERGATHDYASGRPHFESFFVRFTEPATLG